ncbi:BLOC-1-related complex subunit 5 [Eumeta japonica]|uniref:BLOC-1-related complex subunit 5 n=1 Tax=Eumeta variegata TaxID=151549 RepID=A0A4C1Z9L7_EUMVA|nr:BLOC-1-related complex subunit 5 [Eumeta japonica]
MGSEQSQSNQKQVQRAPPVRRGHTIAAPFRSDSRTDTSTSGNNSPGASMCSDSELPYISYTVDRPIGDSPKASGKSTSQRSSDAKKPSAMLQKRQLSLQPRRKKVHDIVVVKEAVSNPDIHMDEHIRRLQSTVQYSSVPWPVDTRDSGGVISLLPTSWVGIGSSDGGRSLDYRPWVRLASRYQAHLAACAQPLAADQTTLVARVKETDVEIIRLHAAMVDRQRQNARNAERLSRVKEIAHQVSRCGTMLRQIMADIEELNNMLPSNHRLDTPDWC